MPPPSKPFPHLSLVLRYDGPARFPQAVFTADSRAKVARDDRPAHSGRLAGSASGTATAWKLRVNDREQKNLPVLPKNVPLVLEVDTSLDLDELRKWFGFELVSEQEEGYVIVASDDLDLNRFMAKLQEFIGGITGSATVAKIFGVEDDPDQTKRLQQILSDTLLLKWNKLEEDEDYTVDVGVACTGEINIPAKPNDPKRSRTWTDRTWARRLTEHQDKLVAWTRERDAAYIAWEELADSRVDQVKSTVDFYGGNIIKHTSELHSDTVLADSFTLRIQIKGKGLRDFVLNYPFLFEVVEPDDVAIPQRFREAIARERDNITLVPPSPNAPAVCVIDSGIQEAHYLLEKAIDQSGSHCFLPGSAASEVADYVRPGGHGTRVAGAILFGEEVPRSGRHELDFWLQNARVLNDLCAMPELLFPPSLLQAIIGRFHKGKRKTRIFNHSLTATAPCRTRHMSAWAAEIDQLSNLHDVLFVVSSGNVALLGTPSAPGVTEHLAAGRRHPNYLCEPASRISNPAQSLQALTVGSVGYRQFEHPEWRSCAQDAAHPSAFSRSGLGIWNSIKPEVVEFGGDNLVSTATPLAVGTPALGRECYPELVRSTMYPPGPAYERDSVGTSFATPKVARIAARLQKLLPDEPCLLYRALIVQSARWPAWTDNATATQRGDMVKWIGYGVPDIDRATSNTDYRTTLVTSGDQFLKAGGCHIYQIPIDSEIRRSGEEYDVLVEVTLSYAAEPRRTRRNRRRYLSTWLDWKSSNKDEPLDRFRHRALKTDEEEVGEGTPFGWVLGTNPNHGTVRGVSRSAGTVQKDWAVVKSNALPADFCIAVVGHQGWSKDPDSAARYTLAVSVEMIGKEIPIYDRLRVSVDRLKAEIEEEIGVEVIT